MTDTVLGWVRIQNGWYVTSSVRKYHAVRVMIGYKGLERANWRLTLGSRTSKHVLGQFDTLNQAKAKAEEHAQSLLTA